MATRGHEKYYNYIQFVTTNVYQRVKIFTISKYNRILLINLDFYRKKYHFRLLGYVIMPNHCHFLIMPNTEIGYISKIMHDWKSYTAQVILKELRLAGQGTSREAQAPCLGRGDALSASTNVEAGQGALPSGGVDIISLISAGRLWQSRFDSFSIYSDKKFEEKLNYIHNNPIRAGLVKNLDDYPWSSYQNYYLNNNSIIKINY